VVPRLWNETIEAHRRTVHDAILEATAELVAEHGLFAVTMSQIAEKTGIGRATLYKYFPDVVAILLAWHDRQVATHLEHLTQVRDQADDPGVRLEAVLQAYALIHQHRVRRHHHENYGIDVVAFLHRDQHLAEPHRRLHDMIQDLLAEAAEAGHIRDEVAAGELADYCLHALQAAGGLPSEVAVRRLVSVTLAGLRPPP
jgi:AcrR family transcriptional regulator